MAHHGSGFSEDFANKFNKWTPENFGATGNFPDGKLNQSELDEDYFSAGNKRFVEQTMQQQLFM